MKIESKPTVKPSQLVELLDKAALNKLKVLIVGFPGTAKTELVKQVARKNGMKLWISHPAICDPTEYRGMPFAFNDKEGNRVAEFIPFGDLKELIEAKEPTLAFFDDIGQAPFATQAGLMQLIQGRQLNGIKISDNVIFWGATNDPTMKAGVTGLIEPLKSRWDTIVNLSVDNDEWMKYAFDNDFDPRVISFHKIHTTLIHPLTLAPSQERKKYELTSREFNNTPCPRTVESVSKLLKAGISTMAALSGACGEAYASQLMQHLQYCDQCPDPKMVIANPESVKLPTNPGALYATITSVAAIATSKDPTHPTNIFKLAFRLDAEYGIALVQMAAQRDIDIYIKSPYQKKFDNKYGKIISAR